jgi:hypothetical protein
LNSITDEERAELTAYRRNSQVAFNTPTTNPPTTQTQEEAERTKQRVMVDTGEKTSNVQAVTATRRAQRPEAANPENGEQVDPGYRRRLQVLRELVRPDQEYAIRRCPSTPEGYEQALKIVADLETKSMREICDHHGNRIQRESRLLEIEKEIESNQSWAEIPAQNPDQQRSEAQEEGEDNHLTRRARRIRQERANSLPRRMPLPVLTAGPDLKTWIPTNQDLKNALQALHVVQRLRIDWPEGLIASDNPSEIQSGPTTTTVQPSSHTLQVLATTVSQENKETISVKLIKNNRRTDNTFTENRIPCFMCLDPKHSPSKCHLQYLLTADQKLLKAYKSGVCYSCMMGTHQSTNCKARRKCGIDGCSRKHHKFFHGGTLPQKE